MTIQPDGRHFFCGCEERNASVLMAGDSAYLPPYEGRGERGRENRAIAAFAVDGKKGKRIKVPDDRPPANQGEKGGGYYYRKGDPGGMRISPCEKGKEIIFPTLPF